MASLSIPSGPDLRLPPWGPYGKRFVGLSHIADAAAGHRWDCFLLPGFHRRAVIGPYGLRENRWHWWHARPDLCAYTLRYELEWKDRVFVDFTVEGRGGEGRFLRAHCVNRTDLPQSLDLHLACALTPNPLAGTRVSVPPGGRWVSALDAEKVEMKGAPHRREQVADARYPGQVLHPGAVDGKAVGGEFFRSAGDALAFSVELDAPLEDAVLLFRYHRWTEGAAPYRLSGLVGATIDLREQTPRFATLSVPVGPVAAGKHRLRMEALGGEPLIFEGWALLARSAAEQLTFHGNTPWIRPVNTGVPESPALHLAYPGLAHRYTVALTTPGVGHHVREVLGEDPAGVICERANDFHHAVWRGAGDGFHALLSAGPLPLEPGEEREVVWTITLDDAPSPAIRRVDTAPAEGGCPPDSIGRRILAATTAANVVYPVHFRDRWILHNTPGRCWNSLYSWDSGMIGIGLAVLDVERSIDSLATYLLPEGDPHAAWVEHGTPLPTQVYQLLEIWNRTQDKALLEWAYPRLRQFYEWLAGRARGSTTARLPSGLLQTWDYFYNSGGWDDYPPQWALREDPARRARVAPCVTTAHAIRFAKTLRQIARVVSAEADIPRYEADFTRWNRALQTHAWDEASGYYAYVEHKGEGGAPAIFRHPSGENFNRGLDGVSPLVAGGLPEPRAAALIRHIADPAELWTPYGLSTVSQSAAYFSNAGYWNGAVWIPHQYFLWKALLDAGRADLATRIATAVMDCWEREAAATYHSSELFRVDTGRGAGWHQFSGLSSPLLAMGEAYRTPGTFTAGFDTWIDELEWTPDRLGLRALLRIPASQTAAVILCFPNGVSHLSATWAGERVPEVHHLIGGTWSLKLSGGSGELRVSAHLRARIHPSAPRRPPTPFPA